MEQLIKLLDVIVWPLTVLIALLIFRKHFGKIISSLGSIKAGAQGIEMNFIEKKLQEATNLIGISSKDGASIIPKEGSSIIPKEGSSIIPKDSVIKPIRRHAETPYQELLELQDSINEKLKSIASQNDLKVSGISNFSLTSDLLDNDLISNQTAHQLKTLIELNNIGLNSPQITHDQVTKMKKLFNNISF